MFFDVYEVVAGVGGGGGTTLVYLSRSKSKYLKQSSWENSLMAIIKATTACTSCTLETRYFCLSRLFLARSMEQHCLGKPSRQLYLINF